MTATDPAAWLVEDRWAKAHALRAETTIGRGPLNTIILRDPGVSRLHAEVRLEPHGYVLRGFGSSGVSVNGVPLSGDRTLVEGDVIEIGPAALRFTSEAPVDDLMVVSADLPTPIDRQETPTRATSRFRVVGGHNWTRHWHWLLTIAIVLLVLAFVLGVRGSR
jgi:hypothetical protein